MIETDRLKDCRASFSAAHRLRATLADEIRSYRRRFRAVTPNSITWSSNGNLSRLLTDPRPRSIAAMAVLIACGPCALPDRRRRRLKRGTQ
jgi:hypothetical protein